MSQQPPPSGSMFLTTEAAPLPSNIQLESIFDTALKSYEKKTKQDLKKHVLEVKPLGSADRKIR